MAGAADAATDAVAADAVAAADAATEAALGAVAAPSALSRRLLVLSDCAGAVVLRWVATMESPSVAAKKIVAQTAVERERKFALPVAPNRLPEAPLPN